ncbi:MAG: NAD-dependent epimerase/dehydratase family protein [Vulcanimicrobiaceae bacterium]
MRIIVTGGAGFIGSHIVDRYLAAGHEVLVVDNLWERGGGRRENLDPRASFVHLDIRDQGLERIFREFKPEIVNHQAAQHSVAISAREPIFDAQVNVVGLLNVLENAVKFGVRKLIFASSAATYGEVDRLPISEATPQHPASPYGITKFVAEYYLRYYRSAHGLDFTALRYGNVYGPRQDPNGEAGVIAIFIGRFLARSGITLFGDGEQTRDYVFVEDVARASAAALERGGGSCYVIGTGQKTSVNELYRTLVGISGFEAPIERQPTRAGDVREAQFDPQLAGRDLGWQAEVPLVAGMRTTYEFFRDRKGA